jgi:hypothetical protein
MNADERGFICRKKAQKAQRWGASVFCAPQVAVRKDRWGEGPREPARRETRPTGCGSPRRAPSVVSIERPLNPPYQLLRNLRFPGGPR